MTPRWIRHLDGYWHSRWENSDLSVTWLGSGRWRWSVRVGGGLIGEGIANSLGQARVAATTTGIGVGVTDAS